MAVLLEESQNQNGTSEFSLDVFINQILPGYQHITRMPMFIFQLILEKMLNMITCPKASKPKILEPK